MPREDKGTCFTCWRLETERNEAAIQRDEARAQAEVLAEALDVAERYRTALAFKKARATLHAYRTSQERA